MNGHRIEVRVGQHDAGRMSEKGIIPVPETVARQTGWPLFEFTCLSRAITIDLADVVNLVGGLW